MPDNNNDPLPYPPPYDPITVPSNPTDPPQVQAQAALSPYPHVQLPVDMCVDMTDVRNHRLTNSRPVTVLVSSAFHLTPSIYAERIIGMGIRMPLAYRYFLKMVETYNIIMKSYYHTPVPGCSCSACAVPRNNQFKVRMANLYVEKGGVKVLMIRFITGNGGDSRVRNHRIGSHRHAIHYIRTHNTCAHPVQFDLAVNLLDELLFNYQGSTGWVPENFDTCDDLPQPDPPYIYLRGHGVNRVVEVNPECSLRDANTACDAMLGFLEQSPAHLVCHVVKVNGVPIPIPDSAYVSLSSIRQFTADLQPRVIQLISDAYRIANHGRPSADDRHRTTLTPASPHTILQSIDDPLSWTTTPITTPITPPPQPTHELCPNCGRRFVSERMTTVPRVSLTSPEVRSVVGDVRVCQSCANNHHFNCPSCSQVWIGTRFMTDTGTRICAACVVNNSWNRCGICGNYTQTRTRAGRCQCENCATNAAIQPYSTRADTCPRGGEGPRYFGIELEVVAHGLHRNRVARLVTNWWDGDAFCKNDGSLPESGFEIVTSPGTLNWHREKWKGFLGKCRTTSGAAHLRSFREQQCGLHIHYAKHSISSLARGRLVAFMNDPNNEPLICAIAGRIRNTYCSTRDVHMSAAINDTGTDHYSATNLCNSFTDEIRVFKGTLNLKRVLLYLDFTDSMMDYCSLPVISVIRGKSFTHYKEFVLANESKWPYLHRYFQHGDAWLKRWAFDADRLLEIPAESVAATDE